MIERNGLKFDDIIPPSGIKKRGRPKKKRIESQGATLDLDRPKKKKKCANCGEFGHNKRGCQGMNKNQTS